jgi:glycosyltransferase involved in cell wall biosynthesis
LAIAGDGPDLEALITLAAELGITDRVDFLGRLDTAELESLRRRSNVVVVPALSPEVFGMVGPEALALGVPVVAYDVGGTSHWLRESAPLSTAVTVGDLDGLVTQLRRVLRESPDEAQRERIARSLADSLSPRRHAGRLLDIYREAQQAFEQGNRASVPSPGSPGQRRHSRVLPPTR